MIPDMSGTPSNQGFAGPPGIPFLGHLLELRADALGFFTRCARRYGDVVALKLGGQAAYLVNRPEHIEEVLVRRGHNFVKTSNSGKSPKGPRRGPVDLMDWIRNFPSDGEAWMPDRVLAQPSHRERKQMLPAFQGRITDGYMQSMVTLTGDAIRGWTSDDVRPMNRDMHRLSLRIVAQTLFGMSVDDDAMLVDAFGIVLDSITRRMRFPYQLPVAVPTLANLRLKHAVVKIEAFIGRMIETKAAHPDRVSLVSAMLGDENNIEQAAVDDEWKYRAMTVFVAGFETTALALTWALSLLARHPEVQARLCKEIGEVCGDREPAAQDYVRLRFCSWVVKETLRLYPPVWLLAPRLALEGFILGPQRVEDGSMILISPWVTHRDPRWFDNAEAFDPDRWSDVRAARMPAYAYFPFSGGSRVCIGRHFAMVESVLALATILRSFYIRPSTPRPPAPRPRVTLEPSDDVPLIIERRRSA